MPPIVVVVVVWFFAAGSVPQIGKAEATVSLSECQAFVAAEVAKQEANPTVRYAEGHCYVQGEKA
jgi:hypothetical protein